MTIGVGFGMAPWWRDGHPENIYRGLDEIAAAGFDGVEVYGTPVQQFLNRPAAFGALVARNGLTLSSVYTHFTYLDPARQRAEDDEFARLANFSAEAGGKWVLLDGGHKPNLHSPEDVTESDIAIVAEAANRYARVAADLGLQLAWHQHWGGIFEWSAPFHRFMAATDPALVNFCPDSAQLAMGDYDVVETFRRYADRMGYVHFKDLAPNHNWEVAARHGGPAGPRDSGGYHVDSKWRMVELGRGEIDFPVLLAIMREAGFDGWIVDDMDYSAYAALECATACREYLRDALGLTGRRAEGGATVITLHIALHLKAGRGADLEALYRDEYVPAIGRQAGFRATTLLRAAADPDRYEIDIIFDTEAQRQAWAEGADHAVTWPRVVALCAGFMADGYEVIA